MPPNSPILLGIRTISGNGNQFTRLGIKAVILAVRLRKATGMPETRLTGHDEWSAVSVFRKVWRRERALRALKLPATGSGIKQRYLMECQTNERPLIIFSPAAVGANAGGH
jgi:hypothetical protein